MSRKMMYFPHSLLLFAALLLILILAIGLIFIGVIGAAFADVGFSPITTALILIATFLGSYINIPILKLKTTVPIIKKSL